MTAKEGEPPKLLVIRKFILNEFTIKWMWIKPESLENNIKLPNASINNWLSSAQKI